MKSTPCCTSVCTSSEACVALVDHERRLERWRAAVEIWAGEKYLRADALAALDVVAQRLQGFADSRPCRRTRRDSVGDQQGQNEFAAAIWLARSGQMQMSVNQPWNQELSGAVDDLAVPGILVTAEGAIDSMLLAVNQNGHIGLYRRAGRVDDIYMGDGYGRLAGSRGVRAARE